MHQTQKKLANSQKELQAITCSCVKLTLLALALYEAKSPLFPRNM